MPTTTTTSRRRRKRQKNQQHPMLSPLVAVASCLSSSFFFLFLLPRRDMGCFVAGRPSFLDLLPPGRRKEIGKTQEGCLQVQHIPLLFLLLDLLVRKAPTRAPLSSPAHCVSAMIPFSFHPQLLHIPRREGRRRRRGEASPFQCVSFRLFCGRSKAPFHSA